MKATFAFAAFACLVIGTIGFKYHREDVENYDASLPKKYKNFVIDINRDENFRKMYRAAPMNTEFVYNNITIIKEGDYKFRFKNEDFWAEMLNKPHTTEEDNINYAENNY